jgi:glyoxylase-like metal-dependent hydrolase (beta-lactamase superfamily II)
MIIKTLPVGPIMANCFIVGCKETLEAAVIDPGDEAEKILASLAESDLKVKFIINTHGHFDHVSANKGINVATKAPILIHALDAPMLEQISASAWMRRCWNKYLPVLRTGAFQQKTHLPLTAP